MKAPDKKTRLVISRKRNESVIVAFGEIEMRIIALPDYNRPKVKLVFEAPPSVGIYRAEVCNSEPKEENENG